MVRGFFVSVWLLALTAPFVGASAADATRDASSAMPQDGVTITTVNYTIPPVHLVRETGQSVLLTQELDDGRPVIMNFIFTTCETTCPLSSQTFAQFQSRLGPEDRRVHMVSISIDPEHDTPQRLRAYANKFHAGPQWQHYTGTLHDSLAAQQAFGAYRGDKMGHTPLTLLRAAPGEPWTRIEGFVTPDQLLHHYRRLLAAR